MTVHRLRDGLWRWASAHPEWNNATDWPETVGSVYCETDAAIVLVDPLVPGAPQDRDRFLSALDRDVDRLGRPVEVLLTCRWHVRSAAELRERYGARVWAPDLAGHGFGGVVTDLAIDGDSPTPGVEVVDLAGLAPNQECVYVLTAFRTVVAGDVVAADDSGTLRLSDPSWYANSDNEREWFRTTLLDGLDRVAAYTPERILVGHGAPVEVDAAEQLRALVARGRPSGNG